MNNLERTIENATGKTVEELSNIAPEDLKAQIEAKFGEPMKVVSHWPIIGRRQPPRLLTSAQINAAVDKFLKEDI